MNIKKQITSAIAFMLLCAFTLQTNGKCLENLISEIRDLKEN